MACDPLVNPLLTHGIDASQIMKKTLKRLTTLEK